MTGVVAAARRRDRNTTGDLSRSAQTAMALAARTGEPPADRALDEPLLALIERRRTQHRRSLILTPLVMVGPLLYSLLEALDAGHWGWWGGALFISTMLIVALVQAQVALTKLVRVERSLWDRRAPLQ
jgi:hypothetical protein